ncbi:tRNA (guanine(37)-N1)-methyltransferase Trm5b [Candidatus Methanoperedenaceae archaeon GB50]|nr:MAG: tRNA (guanine(37)-N1)-methyltransferase Trm5b [Candidatus Methanoperedenaceae archaeon GB50]CAD7773375.1 tRNA (guanine(37)-N1)-methyltransferase Trm5b [Candidatus Methanoperedenaceae archaeon GB50]
MRLDALVVSLRDGEVARRRLIELDLLHRGVKVKRDEKHLYLPLRSLPPDSSSLPDHRIESIEFEEVSRVESVKEILGYAPSFDVIGDIAILGASSEDPLAEADAILRSHKHIRAIFQARTPIRGEFRTRGLTHLRGEKRTTTTYREHGLSYRLDVSEVYFTPRLGTERERVAERIERGVVLDIFAGIGPFSILIGKRHPEVTVIAVEKNRSAVRYLKENIRANNIENVHPVLGDSMMLPAKGDSADHVIMNLPHDAEKFLGEALRVIRSGGIIYYYDITPEDNLYQESIEAIQKAVVDAGCRVEVLRERVVRSYSPRHYNTCIEARVHKT